MIITITQDHTDAIGQRLDVFIANQLPETSRSQVKKMIIEHQILVNNQPARVHQFLKVDDVITITTARKPQTAPQAAPEVADDIVLAPIPEVLAETEHYLVINKPSGLLVHPATQNDDEPTLVDWLLDYAPEIETVGENPLRPGIVHRLDRDVSGVMVVARTQEMFVHLKHQFKEREVIKKYIALVYGNMTQPEGEIDLPIGRNKDGHFVAHPKRKGEPYDQTDRFALTQYRVIKYIKDYSLLEISIMTGRTHQIRAHFHAVGQPIVGDKLYKPKRRILHFLRRRITVVDPGRIFLHATALGFIDLNRERVFFTAPLPEQLGEFLTQYSA